MSQSTARVEGEIVDKKVLPCGRNLLVKPDFTPDYKGRIIIPDSAKATFPTTGMVIALGLDMTNSEGEKTTPLVVGDRVIFSKYAGVEIKFDDGSRFMILKEDDILCVLEGKVELSEESK